MKTPRWTRSLRVASRASSSDARASIMRVVKTAKTSSRTIWHRADVASVVLAFVVGAFVVGIASRAFGGTSRDSSIDAWATHESLSDVDARAFGEDPDACARAASIGTWRRGAEACEGGAGTLARVGCADGARFWSLFGGRTRRSSAKAWVMHSKVSSICGFGRLRATERAFKVRALIGGRRAAFVGDSGARYAYAAFIAAMSDERADVSLKTKDGEKHRDWAHELVGGARATFTWAPYASDATTALEKYASASETPDLIVLSSSLWHVLHDDSVSTYKSAMKTLGARVRAMTAMKPNVVFAWLDAPKIVADALVAEDKRAKFTDKNFEQFFKVRDDQKSTALVAPAGPAIRVRATDVTAACGVDCTADGVHYDPVVYDALAQIIVNIARSRWR
jgi:hypothetical protein